MDTNALKPILAGLVRHALTSLGGMLVASGYMQSSDTAAFIGGGMVIAGMLWSWWQKEGQAKVLAAIAKMHKMTPQTATTSQAAKAATDSVKAVASILLVAFALSFLVAGGSAHAQTGNIVKDIATARAKVLAPKVAVAAAPAAVSAVSSLQKFMNDLAALQAKVVDDTLADLAAADVDAATLTNPTDPTSFRDPIAHACYPAAAKFLQSLPAASPTTGTLVAVQMFQKQRDFVAQIQAGLPVYLKLGCAPLLGDEATTLTKIMGLVGVSVAANTLLPGISAIMPVLP